MTDDSEERWMQLCEQASKEQDADKLMGLVKEIDRLLEEKTKRPRITPRATSEEPNTG